MVGSFNEMNKNGEVWMGTHEKMNGPILIGFREKIRKVFRSKQNFMKRKSRNAVSQVQGHRVDKILAIDYM